MCGTCGCRDAESYEAPFFEMDDLCVSCGADEVDYNSNICKECQIKLGLKKLGAESFEADGRGSVSVETSIPYGWESTPNPHPYENKIDEKLIDERVHEEVEAALAQGSNPIGFGHDRFHEIIQVKNEDGEIEDEHIDFTYEFGADEFDAEQTLYWSHKRDKECSSCGYGKNHKAALLSDDGKLFSCYKCNSYPNEEEMVALYDAESFEAQRKLNDIDRDGKPYTGKIYPDHPNLDSVKADRNNDGYMSSWERALGNQVAIGMERGGYSAEGTGSSSRFPWKTLIAVTVGVFAVSRIKNVEFKAEGGCGCGCSGGGGCGDKKSAEGYPEVYDPVADFLPRYRYPADSVWSNDYNPADPYRPLDYQTVHTDSNTKSKRM